MLAGRCRKPQRGEVGGGGGEGDILYKLLLLSGKYIAALFGKEKFMAQFRAKLRTSELTGEIIFSNIYTKVCVSEAFAIKYCRSLPGVFFR